MSLQLSLPEGQWNQKEHTVEMKTDAFGEIDFCGSSPNTHINFIRVSCDTHPMLLYELLNQQWDLNTPNLLISVIGGVTNFQMKPTLKEVFKRGLIKAAGNAGVFHKPVTCGSNLNQRYYVDELHGHLSCLDVNHSHFILVDNGTTGQYGVEIELRVQLEMLISNLHKMQTSMEIGIPCVVITGTGKIADVICEIYYLHKEEITDDIVKEKLQNHFPEESETRSLVNFVGLKNDGDSNDHELELALIWNRPDIARNKIFTNYGNYQVINLDKFMHTALVNNRHQFVQLFLDHGLNLKKFLNRSSLENLYKNIPNSCLLSKIIRQARERGILNSFGECMMQKTLVFKERIQRTQCWGELDDLSMVIRDLFIWSILLQHKEMSYIFWRKIISFLYLDVACCCLVPAGMFDHCFKENEEPAEELLIQPLDKWGGSTCLELAYNAEAKDFFAHCGVQVVIPRN
uniref:TRPM SLOG domain-containing protein n=1 Tax=Eptatretus burgeri TaxID=7764 RepID=A0A8C4Q5U5_EPTBU